MVVLQASRVSKSFGEHTVLDNGNITLHTGERAGLVGANGTGKTTLLKILAGELPCDEGEVFRGVNATLGFLSQNGGLSSGNTVLEEMLSVFQPLIDQENKLRDMEKQMSENPDHFNRVSEQYALLLEDFRNKGGYEFRANIRAVLNGLGFGEEYHRRSTETLSGGQKTRLAMAKLLLARPDVLLLDEPTNHLDMETLLWLEKYLQSYPGAILAVSHDRYFLDSLVSTVYELEKGRLCKYNGNYTRFVVLKQEQTEMQMKQYQKAREEIARAEDFIHRNIARATTAGRARSRKKALAKMERPEKPLEIKRASFSFGVNRNAGREVLTAVNLSVGYGSKPLLKGIDLRIERGERVALVGPNGAGKSTLLKTLAGVLKPLGGHILLGTGVGIGYYDQEQAHLTGSHTVLEDLWNYFPGMDEKDVRGVLGNFLFCGDDVFKTVAMLSGGEKARLALARLILGRDNLLLLDEPTNHLDIYSREVLEEALANFEGTIMFVSHDRYFLNKLATRTIDIVPGGITCYIGNFDDYTAKKAQCSGGRDEETTPGGTPEKEQARLSYRRQKEAKRLKEIKARRLIELEEAIETVETRISTLEEETYSPEVYRDLDLLLQKNEELEKCREQLDTLYTQWELLINEQG